MGVLKKGALIGGTYLVYKYLKNSEEEKRQPQFQQAQQDSVYYRDNTCAPPGYRYDHTRQMDQDGLKQIDYEGPISYGQSPVKAEWRQRTASNYNQKQY